jgi:hypothetical protein
MIWGDGKLASFVQLIVGALVLGGSYVVAASRLRVKEVSELTTMVRSRVGR